MNMSKIIETLDCTETAIFIDLEACNYIYIPYMTKCLIIVKKHLTAYNRAKASAIAIEKE